jgi:phosphoglycolate phosphatase
VKLVIFDCDGTLVDSQHVIVAAMEDAFRTNGLVLPARDNILGVVGLSLVTAVEQLLPGESDPGFAAQLAEDYKASFAQRRHGPDHREPLYPGVRDIIESLGAREDVVLGIATGKSQRGVAAVLEREGLKGHFATIQTADTHPSKPHPSMILQAMAETGADPADTLMIGDTTYDILMAREAKVTALGVAWGYHEAHMLRGAGAHDVSADSSALRLAIERFVDDAVAV